MELAAIKSQEDEQLRERIQEGLWHDGRIDAVCGNGVMSELGVGIERFREADADPRPRPSDDDASQQVQLGNRPMTQGIISRGIKTWL